MTSALEVAYHTFDSTFLSLRRFSKMQDWAKNTFKRTLPETLDFYVAVFEVKVRLEATDILDLSESKTLYKNLSALGYERYFRSDRKLIDAENFAMSNDYSICQQLAAAAMSKNYSAIRFKSARFPSKKNVVMFKNGNPKLSGHFAILNIKCTPSFGGDYHIFEIFQNGSRLAKFHLDPIYPKSARTVHYFRPSDGIEDDERESVIQRFSKAS
jgi:hypothetical protein